MDLWLRNYFQQTPDPAKATHFHTVTKTYLDVPTMHNVNFG